MNVTYPIFLVVPGNIGAWFSWEGCLYWKLIKGISVSSKLPTPLFSSTELAVLTT